MTEHAIRPRWAIPLAIFVGIFGLLTLKSGGEILFVDGTGREAAGNYVLFIVWFNFLAGFAYLAGAFGLALWRPWIEQLALAVAVLTILFFIAFGIHILMGGAYEIRTVGAMALRSFVWLGVAFSVRKKIF
ncbi:MAG: hypothetical protein HQ513_18630 [Rhodospirillales bacterium]|nr:hypothetical protein [Rhodospirillales bacterium]